jgi:hypothetical protein
MELKEILENHDWTQQLLEDWKLSPTGNGLIGKIYNDKRKRFLDGTEILTSKIIDYIDGRIHTKSGSTYVLGRPSINLFNLNKEV